MTSNSKKMSVEELLVQKIKGDSLASLIGDEDAITELATRAIKEALFQPQRVPSGYGNFNYTEKDSIVVEAGREVAKKIIENIIEKLCSNDEIVEAVSKAFIASLPRVINNYSNELVSSLLNRAEMNTNMRISELENKLSSIRY